MGEAEDIPLFFTLIPVLALLSNYDRENCLINVGTEGAVDLLDSARNCCNAFCAVARVTRLAAVAEERADRLGYLPRVSAGAFDQSLS